MGHKPDRRARKKRREREARSDFRKRLKEATDEARALYRRCRRAIKRPAGGQRTSIFVTASTFEAARDAVALLTHPCNGYTARTQTDSTPDGSRTQFNVVISP